MNAHDVVNLLPVVERTALPHELPPKISANWPTEVLRSAAVEALLRHNDDLTARLAVILRELNIKEARLDEEADQLRLARKVIDNLESQLAIIRSRDDAALERVREREREVERLQLELGVIEKDYAQLYQKHRLLTGVRGQWEAKLQKSLSLRDRYLRRFRKLWQAASIQRREFNHKLAEQKADHQQLKIKLAQTMADLNTDRTYYQTELSNLQQQFDAYRTDSQCAHKELIDENKRLSVENLNLKSLGKENLSLNNQLVTLSRKWEQERLQRQHEDAARRDSFVDLSHQIREYESKLAAAVTELADANQIREKNQSEILRLEHRLVELEAMRAQDRQHNLKLEQQVAALQHMNRLLSQKLIKNEGPSSSST